MISSKFCYIAPTNYLHHVAGAPNHLTLAHLVAKDKKYADFYLNESKDGSFVIMDNSCYEFKRPLPGSELIEYANRIEADAIVLPDHIFEPASKTIAEAEKYASEFSDAGFLNFFVPQSRTGDLEDWISAYRWAAENPEIDIIGISILGVPNALPNIAPAYARVVMMQILLDRGIYAPHKHHHFLGLNAGPGLEIPSLLKLDVLDTIDSSGPIWAAITGHQYSTDTDSLQAVSKIKLPVNFDQPENKDPATEARIVHNIKLTEQLFEDFEDGKQSVWYAQE